jgi:hypothetical protein
MSKEGAMSRTIVLTLIVVVLGLSLIACTTGPRTQRYPRYPNYPYPQGPNYPGYPGYPPGYRGFEQVRNLADDLEDATSEVVEEAKTANSQYQEAAIERLKDLDDEAETFRDQVEQTRGSSPYGYNDPYQDPYNRDPYGRDPYGDPRGSRSKEHFTELLQKYYSARDALKGTPEDDVQKDFARVTGIMRNLTQFYGYRFEPDYDQHEPTIR